ncbi:MAG: hypothetical protein WDW38_010459 [Sanguina aurantia]
MPARHGSFADSSSSSADSSPRSSHRSLWAHSSTDLSSPSSMRGRGLARAKGRHVTFSDTLNALERPDTGTALYRSVSLEAVVSHSSPHSPTHDGLPALSTCVPAHSFTTHHLANHPPHAQHGSRQAATVCVGQVSVLQGRSTPRSLPPRPPPAHPLLGVPTRRTPQPSAVQDIADFHRKFGLTQQSELEPVLKPQQEQESEQQLKPQQQQQQQKQKQEEDCNTSSYSTHSDCSSKAQQQGAAAQRRTPVSMSHA